jgi:hypothetical protein
VTNDDNNDDYDYYYDKTKGKVNSITHHEYTEERLKYICVAKVEVHLCG